jgi:AcrR family transcriptional regulator
MPGASQPPLRRDAQRNREAILDAARQLFAESDDVPMYEIARRAGVGQATLYRNFSDRASIAAELCSTLLDQLEALADEHAGKPDAFFVVLQCIVDAQARLHGLGEWLRDTSEEASQLEPLQRRLANLIMRPLQDAVAAGTLRPDLTVDDVLLVVSMVEGALNKHTDPAGNAEAASRALALVLEGLVPRSG